MVKKRHPVRRIKRSDTEAFRELFEIYQRDIFNFLHFKLGNIEAAEDLIHKNLGKKVPTKRKHLYQIFFIHSC